MKRLLRDPLVWALAALVLLLLGLPYSAPLFAALFPQLDRPLYLQSSFIDLALAHLGLVAASSAIAAAVGISIGIFVTRAAGREFRPLLDHIVAIGQTFPPVAVLAIAAPLLGFGPAPALLALALYGLLPIVQATTAGLESVAADVREAATGLGLSPRQQLLQVELPLAAPVVLSGVRTSVVINIGTAAIASTVGANTLGTPIIVGLAGFNTAYVIQGAVVVALLAVVVDMAFGRIGGLPSKV